MSTRTIAAILASLAAAPLLAGDELLHRDYGFDGLILSKFNDGLAQLRSGDVDGDGQRDLIVVNNPKSKIEILVHSSTPVEPDMVGDGVNELADEETFRRESYATDERVASLAVADMNGDGRADLVYTGDSSKVSVALRAGARFDDAMQVRVTEPAAGVTAVQVGDIDSDGRPDVVVFGRTTTSLFLNEGDGRLAEARELPSGVERVDQFALLDIDGDDLLDLVSIVLDSETPLRVRRGLGGAAFGATTPIRVAPLRSIAISDVDADGRPEVFAVRRRSGRVTMLALDAGVVDTSELALSPLQTVPFPKIAEGKPREYAVGDIDGNGTADVLVSEPSAARVMLYRGTTSGTFLVGEPLPSYVGVTSPQLIARDGTWQLVVAAPDEKAIGMATGDADGTFGFPLPTALPPETELLAIDAAGDEIWTIVESGSRRSKSYRLRRADANDEGTELDVDSAPSALRMRDINGDGLRDALVFVPNKMPAILVATDEGFRDTAASSLPGVGILEDIDPASLDHGDVDGDGLTELLVPGPNFVRAIGLDAEDQPRIVAQYNVADASARIGAVAAGDLTGDGSVELVIVERSTDTLQVLDVGGSVPRRIASVDLAGFTPNRLAVRDVDGDGRQDVLLFAENSFGVVRQGTSSLTFHAVVDYELPKTAMRYAYLDQLAVGDVNGDAIADLVATETSKHSIVISRVLPPAIDYAVKFQVFEEKLFESNRGDREPREVLLDDFTADGLTDIAVLVHDRIIIYPQEPAP